MAEIAALLEEGGLPTADVASATSLQFFGTRSERRLVGVVGIEPYPPVGLLRSLAVASSARGEGIGRALVRHAERYAASRGIEKLFLLTTTAERFFSTLGYSPVSRDEAPVAIRATTQFASLCPRSSVLMFKAVVRAG